MSTAAGRTISILRSLRVIGERIYDEQDLPGLYTKLVQIAQSELDGDCAVLLLCDGEDDKVSLAAASGLPSGQPTQISLRGTLAGRVISRIEPEVLDVIGTLPAEFHLLHGCDDVQAVVYTPLIGQGRVLGTLGVARRRSQIGFGDEERELLGLLAGQLAIAIERVQVRSDVVRSSRLEHDSTQRHAQTEKLAGMGRLASSIAHEINNPLQAIHNSLYLLLNRQLSDDKRTRYLGMAQEQVERLTSVVQRMLNFYQPSRDGVRPTALHPLLEQVLRAEAERIERAGVTVVREWSEGLPRVMGVAGHLKQVFQNLIANAVEAMPGGGSLVVRTRALDDGHTRLVIVEFCDDGPGIPDGEMDSIFEPFYTTKTHGTGLGLAICYSVIEQHGGVLSVRRDGEQTAFQIALPALVVGSGPDGLAPKLAGSHDVEQ
ncbi:MAG TPA: ATP-binding protein [Roseiflexaceae bacterium]|nr:ATP-binding protein [Roseiflexaceae bacterium]